MRCFKDKNTLNNLFFLADKLSTIRSAKITNALAITLIRLIAYHTHFPRKNSEVMLKRLRKQLATVIKRAKFIPAHIPRRKRHDLPEA